MVDAPIHTHQWMILYLIATLVLGGFGFVAPTHASMASMPQAGSTDSTSNTTSACFAQGCLQEHVTCKQHCVSPSNESASASATVTSQNNQQDISVQVRSTEFLNNAPVFPHATDRAPPTHTFLRSVIKRE